MEFPCARIELVEYFRAQMNKDPGMASAVAAIRTLLEFLKRDKGVLLSFIHMCCWKGKKKEWTLTGCLCLFRRNYLGSEGEPEVGHSLSDGSGLLCGCVLRRGALPALHQSHLTGASGQWSTCTFRRARKDWIITIITIKMLKIKQFSFMEHVRPADKQFGWLKDSLFVGVTALSGPVSL